MGNQVLVIRRLSVVWPSLNILGLEQVPRVWLFAI